MRYILVLILSLSVGIPGWGQKAATGKAETTGACSPAASGSDNTFTINCGIGREQGQKMLAILNKILANQLDPDAVMEKLDGILKGVDDLRRSSGARHLSDQQKAILLSAMGQFRGAKAMVTVPMNDPEAYHFAEDFCAVFRSAGLQFVVETGGADKTGINEVMRSGGAPTAGIDIEPPNEKMWNTPLVQGFAKALAASGVRYTAQYSSLPGSNQADLSIWVGTKPQE